jgi:HAD superfamily hydrolase (TIGR01509 family)
MKPGFIDLKAIIFDMDGLLLDSEAISLSTFLEACREHDIDPDLNVYYRCIGTVFARTREIFLEGYGSGFPLESICASWRLKYQDETTKKPVPLKTGVLEILLYLHSQKLPRVVVTSSRWQNAYKKLTNAGIAGYFEFILGGDQISKGKPDPEIYLTACNRLNLAPDFCLALEDSDNGVRAAHSAGLTVIQVPDLLSPSDEVKKFGHTIVESLLDVQDLIKGEFVQSKREVCWDEENS